METNHSYAKIITTIALAVFAVFWTMIDGQLKALDIRLRCVETQLAAISARLGVEKQGLNGSQNLSGRLTAPPGLGKTARGAPIIP